jgi:hypothetical protein
MEELTEKELEQFRKTQARIKRQNDKSREMYDRITVNAPKGTIQQIKETVQDETMNKYITDLILTDLRRRKAVADSRKQIIYPDDAVEIEI